MPHGSRLHTRRPGYFAPPDEMDAYLEMIDEIIAEVELTLDIMMECKNPFLDPHIISVWNVLFDLAFWHEQCADAIRASEQT